MTQPYTIAALADPPLLALAAKKAFRFCERRLWFHDRSQSISFMARLNHNVTVLADQLRTGAYRTGQKIVFPAPKRIEQEGHIRRYVYRPLCTQPFRDEVVEVALLCLFGNDFDPRWGDTEEASYPKVLSLGNRLHLVRTGRRRTFSVGNSRLYRDWADDYARFVRDTEKYFNKTLASLRQGERVLLLCTDVRSFYPSINRTLIAEILKPRCGEVLQRIVDLVFGDYDLKMARGCVSKDAGLSTLGLAQGPAHSGFWANVYMSAFDDWAASSLGPMLRKAGRECGLEFYARYVDDMRFIFRYRSVDSDRFVDSVKSEIAARLAKMNLELSYEKSMTIIEEGTESLLNTGQVAERMQSIARRAYFPHPPETLEELAKEVRLLFHADTAQRSRRAEFEGDRPILDNPGVRSDSRRRFSANKWIRLSRDLETLSPGWIDKNKIFAQELVRAWLEDPGQTQLLQRALEIGPASSDVSRIIARLNILKRQKGAFGYYSYVLAYLLDLSSYRGLPLDGWPLRSLCQEVIKERWDHPILQTKCQQFLLATGTDLKKSEGELPDRFKSRFWMVRQRAKGGSVQYEGITPTEQVSILCGLSIPHELLSIYIEQLLKFSTADEGIEFVRALLPRRNDIALSMARKFDISFFELEAFAQLPDSTVAVQESGAIYQMILQGAYRDPTHWLQLAYKLLSSISAIDEPSILNGTVNPFSLHADDAGDITVARADRRMPTFVGDRPWQKGSVLRSNTRPWALPVGLVLRAAATGRPEDLLGLGLASRLGLAGSFGALVRNGAKLPQRCGIILDRLFAWHGSGIKGYLTFQSLRADLKDLEQELKSCSNNGITLCNVAPPRDVLDAHQGSTFNLVICQVPSLPLPNDAAIRRALSIAQIILQQKGQEENRVDLVVFPELSVPTSSVGTLCRFVQYTGTLVLAGLELRIEPRGRRQLNELMWIVPFERNSSQLLTLRQEKIHVTDTEKGLVPPVRPADPAVIWRIIGEKGRLAAINCYEFTDLMIRDLLRGRIEALVIAANNQDVTTFDNLIESTHYDLFSHVVLVNSEEYGGSAVRAPYRERRDRRIFDIHGSNLFAVNVCSLSLSDFRGPSVKTKKKPPAGFTVQP